MLDELYNAAKIIGCGMLAWYTCLLILPCVAKTIFISMPLAVCGSDSGKIDTPHQPYIQYYPKVFRIIHIIHIYD